MERITIKNENGKYAVSNDNICITENGCEGLAIEKLASFENVLEALLLQNERLVAELAQLKNNGQEKSCTYKQKLAAKLTNTMMIDTLNFYQKL